MIRIINKNIEYELEFNGIKIIECSNPSLFIRDHILSSKIMIDEMLIKSTDIVYINNLTKGDEYINLSKKSFLTKDVIDSLEIYPLINYENSINIINNINNKYDYELVNNTDGDITKIINSLVELNEIGYINKKIFKICIEQVFNGERKLFILDEIEWIKINDLSNYLNEHHFLIITNNFKKYITNLKEIEITSIYNGNNNISEILSADKLINYIETEINEPFNSDDFRRYLNESNTIFSSKISNLIKNI